MENRGKNKKGVIIISLIVIIILTSIYFISRKQGGNLSGDITKTREEVPKDIKVPEPGDTVDSDTAVPLTSAGNSFNTTKLRKYYIKVENDKFMPSKVIVNQGDIISIKFFAVDKDYDIQLPDYNMSKGLKQKEPSAFEFEANMTGLFRYYCDLCGGLNSDTTGSIIVVGK